MARDPGESRSRRAGGTLVAFFAGSVAVHAAVLMTLPGFEHARGRPNVVVLDVMLLKGEPLAAASGVPSARTVVVRQPQPGRDSAAGQPALQADPRAPVMASSEPQGVEGASFTVESAGMPEQAVAAPEPAHAGAASMPPTNSSVAYLRSPAPGYPLASRRAGEQGTVMLRVRVSPDGFATRVAVERSSGSPHLDAAALEAVKAWRFTPARRGTEAIESWMLVPIVFQLEG